MPMLKRADAEIEVQKDWRGPAFLQDSIRRVHAFLAKHTPQ